MVSSDGVHFTRPLLVRVPQAPRVEQIRGERAPECDAGTRVWCAHEDDAGDTLDYVSLTSPVGKVESLHFPNACQWSRYCVAGAVL